MNVKILPRKLGGEIGAISSKSVAHRAVICAALADKPTYIYIKGISRDIEATLGCVEALGARVERNGSEFTVYPIEKIPENPVLDCCESGSTLRFMLPVAAAVCEKASFVGCGRLPERPVSDLMDAMRENGVEFSDSRLPFTVNGAMKGGEFAIAGNVSSQYITGLLLALSKLGNGKITLTTPLASAAYTEITLDVLRKFSVNCEIKENSFVINGAKLCAPSKIRVEGDWSNAAFFLAAGIFNKVTVTGLDVNSTQGDKKILDFLRRFGADVSVSGDSVTVSPALLKGCEIDVDETPDLLPVLAVVAANANGKTVFTGGKRLRLKESDRIESTCLMLRALGIDATELPDGLEVTGGTVKGGTVDSFNDHRIVMSAAVAAIGSEDCITVIGAEAVEKSYPEFFEDYKLLGGETCDI